MTVPISLLQVNRLKPVPPGTVIGVDGVALRGSVVDVTHPDFGATGSGADESTNLIAAEAAAFAAGVPLFFPPGKNFDIGTTGLVIRCGIAQGSEHATITYHGTGTAITYGNTTSGQLLRWVTAFLPKVVQANKAATGWAQAGGADVGIQLINVSESQIHVPRVQNFSVGLLVYGKGTGCVYNNIFIGHLDNNKVNHQLDADATGWSNENNYYGGRLGHQSAEGTNVAGTRHIQGMSPTHSTNNNRWYGPSLEGDVPEYHVEWRGQFNYILFGRYEVTGGAKVLCTGANAHSNVIFHGYDAETLTLTQSAGAQWNQVHSRQGWRAQITATTDGALILSNTGGDAFAILTGIAAADDPFGVTPSTAYVFQLAANYIRGKRKTDGAGSDRVYLDLSAGDVLVGDGVAAAPAWGLTHGGMALRYLLRTANYSAAASDFYLDGDTTAGAFQITLPTASIKSGQTYVVRLKAGANVLTIAPASGTIDGAASVTIAVVGQVKRFVWTGATWTQWT